MPRPSPLARRAYASSVSLPQRFFADAEVARSAGLISFPARATACFLEDIDPPLEAFNLRVDIFEGHEKSLSLKLAQPADARSCN
jgi:hypothetical protein